MKECRIISIIVPVYNPPENLLKECIESLISQSYKNIEIVLIDNASKNNCPVVLKEYADKDKRIKLFRFEENQGFSGACNKGIEIASGNFIQIVDSDDLLDQNACKYIIEFFDKNECDMLVFNNNIFDVIKDCIVPSNNISFSKFNNKTFVLNDESAEIFHLPMCVWNKVFSKSFLEKHKIKFNDKLKVAAPDCLFSATALCYSNRIGYIDIPLYTYRIHLANNVMSSLKKDDSKLYLQVVHFCYEIADLYKNVSENKKKILARFLLEVISFNYTITNKKNRREYFNCIVKFFKTSPNMFDENKAYLPLFYFYKNALQDRYKDFNACLSNYVRTYSVKLFFILKILTFSITCPPPPPPHMPAECTGENQTCKIKMSLAWINIMRVKRKTNCIKIYILGIPFLKLDKL